MHVCVLVMVQVCVGLVVRHSVGSHTCRTYNGFVVPKGRDLQGVGRGGKATAAHRGVCSCRGGGGRCQGTVQ